VRRVSVVGNTGSGKTTVAVAIARALGVPHLELDAVFHQPDWRPLERELFRDKVAQFVAGDGWVVDGNYSAVRDLVWERADTVIWMDLPRHRIMRQLIARTLRRMVLRTELWNGNTEQLRNLYKLDPEQSILRWAWTQHHKYVERYGAAQHDPANLHLTFVRLTSRAQAARFLADLAVGAAPPRVPQPADGPPGEPGAVAGGGAAGE
jgi:adenylate kinase family enzyme